ncbi:DUF6365 family protein [Streptosporangium sp. DT93]|uniref:DUF6365 family protein n=1 Tax=Streptosporangium sp. DT93 TaxID=3393428 RepID=UPI003CFB669E
MRLLYISLTSSESGEVMIALNFARQLAGEDVRHHFVVPPNLAAKVAENGHPYTVLDPAVGAGARGLFDDVINQVRPDLIIVADYFTHMVFFDYHLEGEHGLDPWFIMDYGIPVLPIDIWEWENTDFSLDITAGLALPMDKRILDMPMHLRPVPTGKPTASGAGYPYLLTKETDRLSARRRAEVRAGLSVSGSDRLLVVPISNWQQPEESHPTVGRMARRVPDLIAHYLRRLPAQTRFVFVGSVPDSISALPAEQTRILPHQSAEDYSALLGACDGTLVLNPPATTLVRALLADLPGMFVTNGLPVEDEKDLERADRELGGLSPKVREWITTSMPVPRFREWPMSFHTFMEPLLSGNPYLDAVAHNEILDERAVVEGLTALLYDAPTQERLAAARATYLERIAQVPDAAEAVAEAARRFNIS